MIQIEKLKILFFLFLMYSFSYASEDLSIREVYILRGINNTKIVYTGEVINFDTILSKYQKGHPGNYCPDTTSKEEYIDMLRTHIQYNIENSKYYGKSFFEICCVENSEYGVNPDGIVKIKTSDANVFSNAFDLHFGISKK